MLTHVPLQALVCPWKNAFGTPQVGACIERCLPKEITSFVVDSSRSYANCFWFGLHSSKTGLFVTQSDFGDKVLFGPPKWKNGMNPPHLKEATGQKKLATLARSARKAANARAREIKKMQLHQAKWNKRRLPPRDLSKINFKDQHWWKQTEYSARVQSMTKADQKASMIYEAMRRRLEVQQAWLKRRDADGILIGDWQVFVGFVVGNLPKSWVELDEITQGTLLEEIHSPLFVPPRGTPTFPDQGLRADCLQASHQLLRVPDTDDPKELLHFAHQARKFKDAGFLIVAVDNKTNQSVRYAFQAVEALPRAYRKADLCQVIGTTYRQTFQRKKGLYWKVNSASKNCLTLTLRAFGTDSGTERSKRNAAESPSRWPQVKRLSQ